MSRSALVVLSTQNLLKPLLAILRDVTPEQHIETAETLEDLSRLLASYGDTRLLAFCTGVIVPPDILTNLKRPAYNLHPGPPAYPGLFPTCFAIYDGALEFGATAHVMEDKVDSGPIVGTHMYEISPDIDRLTLDAIAYQGTLDLAKRLAPALTDLSRELRPTGETWSGPIRRKKDFEALCKLSEDVSAEEFSRRYRAVGEGPDHALSIELFGHRFELNNRRSSDTVVRGGRPAPS